MTLILIIYAIAIIAVGFFDYRRIGSFDDFILAGRRRGTSLVTASILASVIGASATMGVVQLAYAKGPAAMLWLGSGALGLLVAAAFVVKRIRNTGAKTLTDVARILIGENCAKMITLVIVIAWTGIIAAQYLAAAKIVASCCDISDTAALVITAAVITAYCTAGGQLSVLKTDLAQFVLIAIGIVLTLFFLFRQGFAIDMFSRKASDTGFTMQTVTYYMLIVGSSFVVGPDIFGRFFAAADDRSAKNAGLISGVILGAVSVAVVSIGLWARKFADVPQGEETLVWVLQNCLPRAVGVVLSLGLLSAVISSADTCLVTASAILGKQITGWNAIVPVRLITVVMGIAAFAIAYLRADIIKTLILSYSVFNCGVIAPLLLAIILAGKRKLDEKLVMTAIVAGGLLGIYSSVTGNKLLTIAAFGLSAVLAGFSICRQDA